MAVAVPGAPKPVIHCAGVWQLAAHLSAVAVAAHLRAGTGVDVADLVAAVTAGMWPSWGRVTAPGPARLHAGLALHRHITTWHRGLPPHTGVTELVACAVKSGAELPAAQHRLIHRMRQRPDRLHATTLGITGDDPA